MIDAASRPDGYPAEWEADVVLKDGSVAHVRPIVPDDGDGLRRFHAGQSAESIYLRFFAPLKTLSDKDVARFTQVDYDSRVGRRSSPGARQHSSTSPRLPIVFKHIAAMPDVHFGIGATVGSVIPTAEGDHSGGRGRGHRLRHDGLQDDAGRRRPARQPGAAALGDRARGAARLREQRGRATTARVAQDARVEVTRPGRSWRSSSPSCRENT